MDQALFEVARRTPGFLPEAEGLALHGWALEAARHGPLLEIGSYCGLSALYLGSAARAGGVLLFTLDHHRGSEEHQPGQEYNDPELTDADGRVDSLPRFRQTLAEAGLEGSVVAVVGSSAAVAEAWRTPLGLVFIDGGHAEDVAMADYRSWAPHLVGGGLLAIHDVFEDPADGGQAPFHVWQCAVAEGHTPVSTTGSLRVLCRDLDGTSAPVL